MTLYELLKQYQKSSFSKREKGMRFERLMKGYLQTDPKYNTILRRVWLWDEFPARDELGSVDTGIDLVAQTYSGEYWAIQCKFFAPNTVIDKPDVDTFLSTSGKEFEIDGRKARFSQRLWISTTDKWTANAEKTLKGQFPPVARINLADLAQAPVDWDKLEKGIHGSEALTQKYEFLEHQKIAFEKVIEYFKDHDRGKLIMACGTGKTFTSLRIAEAIAGKNGLVLFCVPSIALLGQVLREWTAQSQEPLNTICVCSDPKVTQTRRKNRDTDEYSTIDLGLPASTNPKRVLEQYEFRNKDCLTVIFTTYQSIDVISRAQQEGLPEFDIVICDEAHRTTGVTLKDEEESAFVRIHDNGFVKAKRRLYMTATPRIYNPDVKEKAERAEAVLCSMDDETIYGQEIHRIGFGEAVERGLLSDYKVLIFTVDEKAVPAAIQEALSDNKELPVDAPAKLIGCINALSKQIYGDNTLIEADPQPMMRAVAFCQNITQSKAISKAFNEISTKYLATLSPERRKKIIGVRSRHIDGSMSAPEREQLLSWLKESDDIPECKILSNVRCLSEGVDVPSLDAVLFLTAKSSQVDVVQAVGRVMRKAEGKKYGYIIIPIVVPSTVEPEQALNDNERYRVVWSVLNALRSHDDRFNAIVNAIELNKKKPDKIVIGGIEPDQSDNDTTHGNDEQLVINFIWDRLKELQDAIYARIVKKVGDRLYWEQWAKSVAEIAERQIQRLTELSKREECKGIFESFVNGLRENINSEITLQDAIEMLSQHIITAPVFNALFEDYEFAERNPVSIEMNAMLSKLSQYDAFEDRRELEKFYESVRRRTSGVTDAEGKQKVVIQLYDTFFKTAFPKMAERLGIVYTPIEVVDFIIHSVNDVLRAEFNVGLDAENVNILDPFTGTGTFIVRLIQSGLIPPDALVRKYKKEIFANEIVLLAYYIAAVNIENAYHDAVNSKEYVPFEGICFTDTFQLDESENYTTELFRENSERLQRQKNAPITVIIGNPPYSVGQRNANDNAQNIKYPSLDLAIQNTYALLSSATQKKALYDSYIRAFRWATDRLRNNDGIICFVSNGGWLDGNSTAGFRKSLEQEFSKIYVFNLRGNQRTSGELSRREGGKIFGSGSRAPIAITLLVKHRNQNGKAKIYYRDIGDYLSREEKLKILSDARSFLSPTMPRMKLLKPNDHGDWIIQRNETFWGFIPLAPEKKFDPKTKSIFVMQSMGISTNRDAWVYNYSKEAVKNNVKNMINFYNAQINTKVISNDKRKIKWSSSLLAHLKRGRIATFEEKQIIPAMYRPFNRQALYFDELMIDRRSLFKQIFPTRESENLVLCVSGKSSKEFSVLMTNAMTDLHIIGDTQCFPLYYYEKNPEKAQLTIFDEDQKDQFIRKDGISDWIVKQAVQQYGIPIKKEDIFFYVYGFLHSPDYRQAFSNDLKRSLPRIPLVENTEDFWKFCKAGRELAELHLNYESVAPLDSIVVKGDRSKCRVQKMRFLAKDRKDTIIFNENIRIENIPALAYEYILNGRSAIEWVMERYQYKVDKDSGIVNDPNKYAEEIGKPTYILDLLLSVISVSVKTMEIVRSLPKIKW